MHGAGSAPSCWGPPGELQNPVESALSCKPYQDSEERSGAWVSGGLVKHLKILQRLEAVNRLLKGP